MSIVQEMWFLGRLKVSIILCALESAVISPYPSLFQQMVESSSLIFISVTTARI